MIVTTVLNVSQKEFFDYVEKSLQAELSKENIEKKVYSGLTYEKRMKKDNNPEHDKFMHVEIKEFDRKGLYQSVFTMDNIEYHISYKVLSSTKDSIELQYEENYKRLSKLPKILSFILPHKVIKNSKKRMLSTLKLIEKAIVESRN